MAPLCRMARACQTIHRTSKLPRFEQYNSLSISNILCMLTVPSTSVHVRVSICKDEFPYLPKPEVTSESVLCCWDETCRGAIKYQVSKNTPHLECQMMCCRKMLWYLKRFSWKPEVVGLFFLAHWSGVFPRSSNKLNKTSLKMHQICYN